MKKLNPEYEKIMMARITCEECSRMTRAKIRNYCWKHSTRGIDKYG